MNRKDINVNVPNVTPSHLGDSCEDEHRAEALEVGIHFDGRVDKIC
jgi:hypothetical protein